MRKNTTRFFSGFAAIVLAAVCILTGCPQPGTDTVMVFTGPEMRPGSYTATARGLNSDFTVRVDVDKTKILDITVSGMTDSPHTGIAAVEALKGKILREQSAGVSLDGTTGATISRNGFIGAVKTALQKAGAGGRLLDPVAYAPREETWDVDILIAGSGIAGLSAAVQASKEKPSAKIVLIEKLDYLGGSTKFAAGVVLGPEAGAGYGADKTVLKAYYKMRGQGWVDNNMVDYWVENTAQTLDLLGMAGSFAIPSGTMLEGRMRVPGNFTAGTVNASGGYAIVLKLLDEATTNGVTVLKGTELTGLIMSGAAVTGARATSDHVNYTFNAKAVIIATGGYDSDRDLMGQYNRDSQYDIAQSSKGNAGEGIKIAQRDARADTVFKGGKVGWVAVDPSLSEAMHYTAFLVKADGSLLSEAAPSNQAAPARTAAAMTWPNSAGIARPSGVTFEDAWYSGSQTDYAVNHILMLEERARAGGSQTFWGLYRQRADIPASPGPFPPAAAAVDEANAPDGALPTDNYAYAGGAAFVKRAASVAALAALVPGMTETNLQTSFAAAKLLDADGDETSNGTGHGGDWILVKAVPSSIGSMGGLKIDTDAQVLSGGAKVRGLYAAGETANGDLFYREYPGSGSSLSISSTFGWTAGKKAAASF